MPKNKNKKGGPSRDKAPIITDPRFSSVHSDPRFKLPNLNNLKLKVDERFNKAELTGANERKSKYDRYGRRLTEREEDKSFDRLFKQDVPKSEGESESESEKSSSDSDVSEDSESESEEETKVIDRARGVGIASDEESSGDSDSDSSDEELEEDEESEIELEEEKPEEGDPERRFAVVNLDWDNVTSVDLFAAFTSFLPLKGEIKNISIFPSEYGKEKMQQEDVEGPPRDLFQSKKQKKKEEEEDSDSDSDSDISDIAAAAKKLYEEGDGEDYDSKALRRYQLQRLRYYYAVVTCDSIATAKAIYDNCDGTEFESSANIFDLRYIPDEMEFDDEPRDSCNKIPLNYKPNTFVTDALQSSKAKLTWDETPVERAKISTKAFSQREIEEMDFKAYLASESEDEDEEEMKNKYKNLAQSSTTIGNKSIFDSAPGKDDEGIDMEITFTPGLADGAKKEEEEEKEETTISAYKRKEKERRKKRLEKFKQSQKASKQGENDDSEVGEDVQRSKKQSKEQDSKKNAELELLTMDTEGASHFNMKDVLKAEKEKSRKRQSKKLSKQIDREMVQDDFKVDLSDPRFKEIFESHDFAIDPTMPNFKKTEVMKQILQERQKRRKDEDEEPQKVKKQKKKQNSSANGSDLSTLVQRVKNHK